MPHQKTQQKLQTFRGKIENVQSKNTRSGLAMVVFTVDGYAFKAFGDQAKAAQQLNDHHADITAKHNTYMGKDEYAVVTIAGEVGGHPVTTSDTSRSVLPSSAPQQKLKNTGRHQWNLRAYGSNVKAREVGFWLNRFFDDLTEAEWQEWKKHPNSNWPIHDADRVADQLRREQCIRQFKENYERDYGKPFPGSDVDILCLCYPGRPMPQDLESVKARFYKRLEEVHDSLRRKASTSTQTSAEPESTFKPNEDSAQISSVTKP